jgi:phosphate transport system substrate-binding protein
MKETAPMRSTMRRLVGALAVVCALAVIGAACGDDSGSQTSNTTQAPSQSGGSGATTTAGAPVKGTIAGSGATFPKPFYDEMIIDFQDANPGATVTYAGGGSGKGRTDLQEQLVDFAGSDGVVNPADVPKYKGGAFLYFPTVTAPITVSYNLSGVDDLKLTPEVIAKIFQRQITSWDDPAIKADNPNAKLSGNIVVAHRSDGSGTTENFTKFLNKSVGPNGGNIWTLGSGSTVEWPADTQAGNGNGGVAQIIKDTPGAVGYVDLSDAKATSLSFAQVKNKAGTFLEPTLEGASAAAQGATINADLTYDPLWADGADAYPIAAPTWILVYQNQSDKTKAETTKAFLRFILTDGQDMANDLDYAQLPEALQQKAIAQLDQIVIPS